MRRRRPALRLGGRPAARARRGTTPSSTRCTSKGFTKLHPEMRDDLRGTYAGLASEPALAYLREPRRHRGRAAARSTTSPTRASSHDRGLTNYWGYSSIGYLAPHALYAATGTRGEQVREFKGMVKALHGAGIEVILDVVYNHTAEGNHLGPMLVLPGRRQPELLPADARRPALLHGLHGHRQLAQPRAPVGAAADHGLAALLGARVPRRRLPLRPRLGARARVLRRRPPLGVLRHDPPGPGAVAGEADRRAVGRRAGRLPGRQLPGALGGVEREVPRRGARLLARRRRTSASSRSASPAPPTSTRTTAATRSRRSTSSPRTTASRCATSSRTTRSTTRRTARTTATAPTTTARGTSAPRATTDDPAVLALRARQQRNFLATLLLSQGVPMLLGGDELGRTQGGNNNAWCQDNEISWFDWERADAELLEFARRADRAAARASGLPADVVPERDGGESRAARRLVVPPGRAADDAARLDEPRDADARRLPQRPRDPRADAARRADRRRLVPAAAQRALGGRRLHAADAPLRLTLGRRAGHRRGAGSSRSVRARSSRSTPTP